MAYTDQPETSNHNTGRSRAAEDLSALHARLSYKRTIRVMCLFLAAGLILLSAGLAGRTLLNRGVSSVLKSELITAEPGNAEKVDELAREASVHMVTALVRSDYNGFFDAYSLIPDDLYDLIGNPYMKENLIGPFFSSAREKNMDVARNARERLMSETGSYRLALRAAAYYREMIIIGAALILLSLLVIYMKGACFADFSMRKCWPVLVVFLLGAAGVVISFVVNIRI